MQELIYSDTVYDASKGETHWQLVYEASLKKWCQIKTLVFEYSVRSD